MRHQRRLHLKVAVFSVLVASGLILTAFTGINRPVTAAEICKGDFDHSGTVDGSDLAAFAEEFGRKNCFLGKSFTLHEVLQREEIRVGVLNWDLAGFYVQQNTAGLEADLARALAAAIFADVNKINFIRVSAGQRFTRLLDDEYDVLLRVATFTLTRDADLNLHFCPTYFFDGQGIMFGSGTNLNGSRIGVLTIADYRHYLAKYMAQKGLSYAEILYDNSTEMFQDYENGDVDAVSYERIVLNANRSQFSTPGDHVILEDLLSKEPLSPVVRQDDDGWYDIVKWIIYALFQAEELGIDSGNVDNLKSNSTDPEIRRFLGVDGSLGQSLGLPGDWAYQIIKHVGNYAEIYDRNLGPFEPTYLPRGKNKLHNQGGMMYAPPMR